LSDSPQIAQIAVIPPIVGHELLTYRLPPTLVATIREGMRVLVPLGPRQVTGIVIELGGKPPAATPLREVLDVLDEVPLLSPDLLALCRFAATYYMATLGEVLATAVLAGLRAQSRRTVRRLAATAAPSRLSRLETEILRRLPGDESSRAVAAMARSIGPGFYAALRSLAGKRLIAVEEQAPRAGASVRYERLWKLARPLEADELAAIARRAKAQAVVLERLAAAGDAGLSAQELGEPATTRALRALHERKLVRVDRLER